MHALPDVLGADRARFAGKRVLVVDAGHSAANTLIKLAALAKDEPGTTLLRVIRNAGTARLGADAADGHAARGQLGSNLNGLVESDQVEQLASFEIDDVQPAGDQVTVTGRRAGEAFAVTVEVAVNAIGFRPDPDMLDRSKLPDHRLVAVTPTGDVVRWVAVALLAALIESTEADGIWTI